MNIRWKNQSLFSERMGFFVCGSLRLTLYDLRKRINAMLYALCSMQYGGLRSVSQEKLKDEGG
jgi:hypothetical protein